MNRKERLEILKKWEATVKEAHRQWDKYDGLLNCDSDFGNAIWFMEEEYTKAVGARLGLQFGELSWWQYENNFGKSGREAGTCDADMRPMKTLKQYERFMFPANES